jgi:hypothetical protein
MLNLSLSPEESFLIEAIHHKNALNCDYLGELYRVLGDAHAYDLCMHNKVASIAYDALSYCGLSPTNKWLDEYTSVSDRISEYMEELDKTADLLAKQDIPLLALKNSGIARALYPRLGASPMGDIDVLVRKQDFRRAHEILVENGYVMKFRSPLEQENLDYAEQGGGAEYSVKLPSGGHLWFELQWRPVAGRWIRSDQEPTAEELVDRSHSVDGSAVRLLSPEDNLLQVSLHTAKHTYVRAPGFRLHTDVDRIVRGMEIDWDRFVGLVINLQVKTAVFFSLAFARELLGTPIPLEVLERIKPATWKVRLMSAWLQRVGLFDPDGKKWGRIGYIVFVSLLYDDLQGLVKGVFPSVEWMKEKYNVKKSYLLPFYYLHRLLDILLKRILVE